jgi:hypothetical protein
MKQRIQGIILGFLMAALFMGTVTVVAATRTIQATYGVRVVVNGIPTEFAHDMQPFVSEGRTFLPVRGIADAFGADVQWVAATQTVYLNTITPAPTPAPIPQPTPTPMPTPQPRVSLFDAAPTFEGSTWPNLSLATVNMQGNPFIDSLRTHMQPGSTSRNGWTHHNLNNQYSLITGTVGRIDGSSSNASNIIFIGDGRQLASFTVDGNTSPFPISVDVTGVNILRIEINQPAWGAWIAFTNALIE